MKKYFLFYLLIFSLLTSIAQTNEIDSLNQSLLKTESDSSKLKIYFELFDKLISSDPEKALEYNNMALLICEENNDIKNKATGIINTGKFHLEMNNTEKAILKFESALEIYQSIDNDIGVSRSLNQIGRSNIIKGDYDLAVEYLIKSEQHCDTINNKLLLSDIFSNLGNTFYYKGNYNIAIEYYQKSKIISEIINNNKNISICLSNIGNCHANLGNYSITLEYYQKALKSNEEIQNIKGMADCFNNIGLLHSFLSDFDKAIEYYNKALLLYTKLNYKDGLINTLNNIGIVHVNNEKYQLAMEYYHKSLSISKELENLDACAMTYSNIGNIYLAKEQYSKALSYYFQALDIDEKLGKQHGILIDLNNIGEIYFKTNRVKKAIDFHLRSLQAAISLGVKKDISLAYESLSQDYEAINKYKKSHAYYKLYKVMNDSIYNEDSNNQLLELEEKYQSQQKQQQIEIQESMLDHQNAIMKQQKVVRNILIGGVVLMLLLVALLLRSYMQKRTANKILAKQKQKIIEDNQSLEELNATKDKFFSIIAHDLRGPLGSLYSLGEFLWSSHDEMNVESRKEIIERLAIDAKGTFNLLNNLLQWASSNSGNMIYNPELIFINEIINENFNIFKTKAESKKIALNNFVENDVQVYADFDMLNTIVRNLLSNAIKFTPENGCVEIHSKKESNDSVEIIVSDNGTGIKQEILENLFNIDSKYTIQGTNNEKGSGLGLKLCEEFVEKNKGKIWVESKEKVGSKFWLSLPSYKP